MTAAFTLVELAIVLVIIGLVIGGVFVGQDLIYSAQLRATMQDIEKFKTAVNTFKTKYNCIPGDCPNAYDYFGSACGPNGVNGVNSPVVSWAQTGNSINACNGNGDGNVDIYSVSSAPTQENLLFWQELALASLISGKYSGVPINTNWIVPNTVVPAGRISNTVYGVNYFSGAALYGKTGNFFQLSLYDPTAWAIVGNGFMTAQQAFAMDTKFDDGVPSSGNILVSPGQTGLSEGWAQSGCTANWRNGVTSTTYLLNNTNSTCMLYFTAGF